MAKFTSADIEISAKDQTKKGVSSAKKGVGALTKAVKSYGAEIAAVYLIVRKAMKVVTDLTDAYSKQEMAIAKMESALRATGDYTPILSDALQTLARELQNVTTYGDEATLEATALLQSLANLNEQGLKQTIPLILDFAAGMNIDLNTAASLIGKTLGSTTNALSRYGIVLDATAPQVEKLAQLQDAINEKFGGRAVDLANTYTGQVEQLKNQYGDLKEQMGFLISQTMPIYIEMTSKIIDKMSGWIGKIGEARKEIAEFRKALGGMTEDELIEAIKLQDAHIASLVATILPIQKEIEAIEGLEKTTRKQRKELKELNQQYDDLIPTYDNALKVMNDYRKALEGVEGRNKLLGLAIEDTIKPMEDLTDKVIVWSDQMALAGLDAGFFTTSLREQIEAVQEVIEVYYEWEEAVDMVGDSYKDFGKLVEDEAKKILDAQKEAALEVLEVWQTAVSGMGRIFDQFFMNQSINLQNWSNRRNDSIDAWYEKEREAIEANITDEDERRQALEDLDADLQHKKDEHNKEYDKKKRALARKQAKEEKMMALFQIAINTAAAIVKSLPNYILAAIVFATGAIEAAIVAARPLPYQLGGMAKKMQLGGYGGGDTVPALLEPGEMIMRKEIVRDNMPALAAMSAGEGAMFHITVNLGSRLLYDDITKASKNGQIIIDANNVRS